MYSIKEVAELIGIKKYRIDYAIGAYNLQVGVKKIAGNRIFTDADVLILRAHFNV